MSSHVFQCEKVGKVTKLFSYEKSSSIFDGASAFDLSHAVIPLPARSRVGIHPVKIVLQYWYKKRCKWIEMSLLQYKGVLMPVQLKWWGEVLKVLVNPRSANYNTYDNFWHYKMDTNKCQCYTVGLTWKDNLREPR